MNRVKIANRLAGNTNSYHSYQLNDALEGIAAAGFSFVELSAVRGWTEHVSLEASPSILDGIRRSLDRLNLTPVSLGGHSDVSTPAGLDDALKALELCRVLNIGIMITAAGREGGESAFVDNMHRVADKASEHAIEVAIETAGDMAPTGNAAAALIGRLGRPELSINYDTANVEYYGGVAATSDLPEVVAKVGHVHLKDKRGGVGIWDFPALGEGHIDLRSLLEILGAGGFGGPVSVEVEFLGEPWPPLGDVHRAMQASHEHLAGLGWS